MRIALLLAAIPLSLLCSPSRACGDKEAISVATQLFTKHRSFYADETPGLKQLVSGAFYQTLKAHYRCAEKEGICHLDYEPWLGAQDGEVSEPVRYEVSSRAKENISVTMSYLFFIASDRPKKKQKVVLRLQLAAQPQCWVINDLITPVGDSLAKRYRGQP
jgi:hypothetical protein